MNNQLSEGLRKNDLESLVLPLISIDEYESKVSSDQNVIVVGFFVDDEDPAVDLSNFISRSVEDIIDTDVSPAPNEDGYFMVFVEIGRNKEFPNILMNIVKEINQLISNNWKFKAYKVSDFFDVTEENIEQNIRLDNTTNEEFHIKRFFHNALVEDIYLYVNNNKIIFEKRGILHTFDIVKFGYNSDEMHLEEASGVDFKSSALNNRITALFGDHYSVIVGQSGKIWMTNGEESVILQ